MIKAEYAIAVARSLIGTPYSEMDCINLIKRVIRTSPGGVSDYTTAGTNTLWRSFEASAKYRDLTWRQGGLAGAGAGMLAFKARGDDVHHVGIVTGEGTVIHSSSAYGGRGVVETALSGAEGWTRLARHRYIETTRGVEKEEEAAMEAYRARVNLTSGVLNVRSEPGKNGDIIDRLENGAEVIVREEYENGWRLISYGAGSGYVSGEYLAKAEKAEAADKDVRWVFTDSDGNTFIPAGDFRAELRAVTD